MHLSLINGYPHEWLNNHLTDVLGVLLEDKDTEHGRAIVKPLLAPPVWSINENGDAEAWIELPGTKTDDIEITSENNKLSVSAIKKIGKQQQKFNKTWSFDSCYDLQATSATLQDGVLNLVVKKQPGKEKRKIDVTWR